MVIIINKTVTVLNGSPNKSGHTKQLLDIFMSKAKNFSIIEYNMYDMNIKSCCGCGICSTEGKCTMNDMNDIIESIFESDFIVFASPVYNYSFPSSSKAFLDRLQPLYLTEKRSNSRKGFLLVSAGKSGKYSFDIMKKQAEMAFSELGADFSGSYIFPNTDKQNTLHYNQQCEVATLADKFFNQSFLRE